MINKRILYTRPDGGVSVCLPAPECLSWLSCGGYWTGRGIDLDEQVERCVAAGHYEWAARRFVEAMDRGGCTTAEAYAIIRDRDCAHLGTACELIDASELPDRWFRDAWRRGHNGGPISMEIGMARRVQYGRIQTAARAELRRREANLDVDDATLPLQWGVIRDRLRKAQTQEELMAVWPEQLGRPQ